MTFYDKMSREQLLVAVFFATPQRNRFGGKSDHTEPMDVFRDLFAWRDVAARHFSDEGLRHIVAYWEMQQGPWASDEKKQQALDNVVASYHEAIRKVHAEAMAAT